MNLARLGRIVLGAAATGFVLGIARRRAGRRISLRGRVVLITGGGRGLGFVLARELARAGALVALCGRSRETLERAQNKLRDDGIAVEIVTCDVRDRAQVESACAHVAGMLGPIDVVINNAGTIEVGALEDQGLDDFHESIDTHVWGPLYTTLAVLPSMRSRGRGAIVNVSSIGGIVAPPHLIPYSVGKFALVGLSQGLAAELRPHGIAVTCVTPGLMRTGSPDRAFFKGNHRAEYAWFSVSDANPLISTSAEHAARRIVRGIERREALVTIGAPAVAARVANALFPETTTRALALAARLLPAPGGGAKVEGRDSHSPVAPSVLTLLDRIAARRNNEI